MKTDGTPLHGSYFDLATAKYPDLRGPASGPRKRLPRRRGVRFGVLPAVLAGALVGVAWLALALKPEENVRLAVEARDRPASEPALDSESVTPPPAVPPPIAPRPATSPPTASPEVVETPTAKPAPLPRAATPAARTAARSLPAPDAGAGSPAAEAPVPARVASAQPAVAASPEPPALVPARKIFAPSPEYPDAARHTGEQGTVVVDAEVDATGAVTGTTVVRGRSPALDAAAAAALEGWRFEPARRGDAPVASTYRVGIKFTLREPADTSPRRGAGVEAPSAPLEVGGEVEPPRRLRAPLPAYPDAAWAHGVTGDVLVRAVIDETGAVAEVEVVKGLPYGMTEAAVEAIRRWKFAPATRHGQPVAVYRNLSVRFEG